jgi:hypothetical protein
MGLRGKPFRGKAMPVEDVHSKAEDLLQKADKGDKNGLSDELNKMTIEDRMSVVKEMQSVRDQERKTNEKLPAVELTTTKDAGGREHLQDMKMVDKGWIWDSKKDVYDPPGDKQGSGMLGQAVDSISSRNRQLAEAMGEK